jgi:hypothetical protein
MDTVVGLRNPDMPNQVWLVRLFDPKNLRPLELEVVVDLPSDQPHLTDLMMRLRGRLAVRLVIQPVNQTAYS